MASSIVAIRTHISIVLHNEAGFASQDHIWLAAKLHLETTRLPEIFHSWKAEKHLVKDEGKTVVAIYSAIPQKELLEI